MPQGLMVNVQNGSGLASLFHPTLPFSYFVGNVNLSGTWGPNVHKLDTTFEAPFELNKPWFILSGSTYNVGSYYIEKVAGTTKTYRITAERYISLIDPRNGYVYWLNPDKPLIENATIKIGDIRG
ncbi:TPA: hypothetical protein ACVB8O_002140 [Acinetobacter baumannii]